MVSVDLNCDMGEGIGNDEEIMPFITSANIACGFHAGDNKSMRETILLCQKHGVAVGAHPSFPDKENFGRKNIPCTDNQVFEWVQLQLKSLKEIAEAYNATLHHVKPHGALYNMAAVNAGMAKAIALAIKETNDKLVVYGLSGSHLISESIKIGLKTASEVFADRTYLDEGTLTPRTEPGALIEDEEQSVHQVLGMVSNGRVKTMSGKMISIVANTICIHGDGKNAVAFAKRINQTLKMNSIDIKTV
ncbi:MAG: 5-oxoprolinase subunit PxpA [Flavisolibacter sp.]